MVIGNNIVCLGSNRAEQKDVIVWIGCYDNARAPTGGVEDGGQVYRIDEHLGGG